MRSSEQFQGRMAPYPNWRQVAKTSRHRKRRLRAPLSAVATKPIADVSLASPVRRTSRQAFGLPARLWPMSALRLLHPEAAGAARLPICFDDRAFSRCLRHGRAPRTSAQGTVPSRQAPRHDREKTRAAAANRQLIGLHMTGSTPPCSGRRRKGCE